jgi:tRNA pseudouridine38-40 synthase
MRSIKLLIEYDGTDYHGWQSQKSGGTIQDILVQKVREVTGEEVKLTGASRTDAGVHALGQVAAFPSASRLEAAVIGRALNAKLPPDIRILRAEDTTEDFHPRYDARSKSYFYIVSQGRPWSAFFARYAWNITSPLDTDAMERSARLLCGKHDFSAFMGSGCSSRTQVRTVSSLDIIRLDGVSFMTAFFEGEFIKFRIEADAFLRHMVRNIVGTLVEVGRGKISEDHLAEILASRDRTKAGPTAPAQGLFLERITY